MNSKLPVFFKVVETIGNANEDVIRANVQNQLKAMNENEAHAQQLGLF